MHSYYIRLCSAFFHRMRFFPSGGVHAGTFDVLPWVGRSDEGGVGDAIILIGKKDDPEVAVLASSEVALN